MNDPSPTRVRYVVLAALCAASAIAYIQRSCLSVSATTMGAEWDFTLEQMGWVLSIWLWTYAIFQVPAGWLGDVWGSQRALPLYCLIWSIATLLTALTPWFSVLLVVRLLFGAAQAGIFPCAAIIVRNWFPENRRAMAAGWIAACQQLGAVIGSFLAGQWLGLYLGLWRPAWAAAKEVTIPPLPEVFAEASDATRESLRSFFAWTGMFIWFAVPGFVWSVWFWRWFRDRPHEHPSVNAAELSLMPTAVSTGRATSSDQDGNVWWAMLTSRTMWLICGQQFCRGFGYIFYLSWFPTFLEETRHVSVKQSGTYTALTLAAALVGALAGGGVSDFVLSRTGSRRWARQGVAIFGLLGASVFAAGAYFVQSPGPAVAVLCVGSFLAAIAGPASYSQTIDLAGKHTATVFGTMNMMGNVGAAVFPVIVPSLLKLPDWLGLGINGWDLVLFTFASIYAIAAVCWVLLNPEGTIFDRKLNSDQSDTKAP